MDIPSLPQFLLNIKKDCHQNTSVKSVEAIQETSPHFDVAISEIINDLFNATSGYSGSRRDSTKSKVTMDTDCISTRSVGHKPASASVSAPIDDQH